MEYETLEEYTKIAKKTISKFGNRMYPSLTKTFLKNDEFVSEVATAIMTADWKWDPSRTGKSSGMKKTLYSYRNQCAIWAIKTLMTKKYKKDKKHSDFLKYCKTQDKNTLVSDQTPEYDASLKEETNNLKDDVRALLDCSPITQKQKDIIRMYFFEKKTFSEIGMHYNVTREAIRQNLKKGLEIIRNYAN